MDDTQKSRTSDVNSTRKRRSSILKSQRPPRTPFSELEFNVATPTDTVKSRRVSFSRRTGVAEFVTNEATTTWKNFYEEHNKSLESSSNDSQVKASRQPIGHIGKRIFDEQFEEVEAVDFLRQVNNPGLNINTSINNINLTQQLDSLENTDNIKLSAPHTNFELSTFTENHSKLFGDELTTPTMGEMSGRIDVNFSDLQSINQGKDDDLDEIQRDLERAQNNINYAGPFADRQNMSEYIEIDLNTTHITMGKEQSDMSITDTIHSQVQDVSKSCSIDKKLSDTKDWVTDKENIAINPYVTPRESVNFAINEETDKVLVFDGKRLTLQSERDDKNYRKSLLTNGPVMVTPQRKTIVLNVNDDLPNFVDDLHISNIDSFKGIVSNYCDKGLSYVKNINISNIDQEYISMTETAQSQNMVEKKSDKSRTLMYENDTCNISMTQALPANIIQHKVEKSQTILYENGGNMSVTEAVPMNIVVLKSSNSDKRKTIVFEDDMANISITQALPVNIINENMQNRRTILYDDDDIPRAEHMPHNIFLDDIKRNEKDISILNKTVTADVPFTHGISSNILGNGQKCDKNRTVIFGNDTLNISVTQAIPNNIIVSDTASLPERRKTIQYENDMADLSVTEAISKNILLEKKCLFERNEETRSDYSSTNNNLQENGNLLQSSKTIYDNDTGSILAPEVISINSISKENDNQTQRRRTIVYDNDAVNISDTQAIPSNIISPENEAQTHRRRTIVYENDAGNISVTQAIPSNIILPENELQTQRRRTIVYENDAENISVTQAIPSNIILPDNESQIQRRRTIVYENDAGNISVTQAIPSNIILPDNEAQTQRRRTIVYENDAGNISVTQAIPSNIILPDNEAQTHRRRTIVYENDAGNISVTQAISSNIILPENESQIQRRRTIVYENDAGNISVTQAIPSNIILPDNEAQTHRRRTIVYENDAGNISVTQAIPSNIILPDNEAQTQRRRTIVYENDAGNISVTQAIPNNIILPKNEAQTQRRRTIVYEKDAANISVTEVIPSNIILPENEAQTQRRRTIVYENDAGNISVTQTIPSNIILPINEAQTQRRRTIVYENDEGNISVTQAIPSNIILRDEDDLPVNQSLSNNVLQNKPITGITNNNRVSRVKAPEAISTSKINIQNDEIDSDSGNIIMLSSKDRKETFTPEEDKSDFVMATVAVDNTNLIQFEKKRDSKGFHNSCEDIMTEVKPSELLVKQSVINELGIEVQRKSDNIAHNNKEAHYISATQEVLNNFLRAKTVNCAVILGKENNESEQIDTEKQISSTVLEGRVQNADITKPIPSTLSSIQNESIENSLKGFKISSELNPINKQVLLYQVITKPTDVLESKTTDQSRSKKAIDDEIIISSPKIMAATDIIQDKESSVIVKKNNELSNHIKIIQDSDNTCYENKVDIEKTMDFQKSSEKPKVALDDLLDMSKELMESETDNKNVIEQGVSAQQLLEDTKKEDIDNISAESMFYITKDSDDEDQPDKETNKNVPRTLSLTRKEENPESDAHLLKQSVEFKSIINESKNSPPINRHYEQIVRSGTRQETENNIVTPNQLNSMKEGKCYKTADDTDYLLQMLSDLTENKVSDMIEEDEKPESIMVKDHLALENKTENIEMKQISFEPKRQSVALSREDMLNNISMARATLQKSRLELDESENFEDTGKDSSAEQESPRKKTVRMSNEVVKTLNFEEDDTASETSIKSDKISPLKKTAFGETSYMKERKAKVIPSYLKDVSDGIKALMHDLVKPTADTMLFDAVGLDKSLKKNPSTCSTQIQANLMTSSQIDLSTELYSNPTSVYDFKAQAALAKEISSVDKSANLSALKCPFRSLPQTESDKSAESVLPSEGDLNSCSRQNQYLNKQKVVEEVLVFDHENPLNNVFLAPTGCATVHRYNPIPPDEAIRGPGKNCFSKIPTNDKDIEVERVSMQYSVNNRGVLPHLSLQSGDICVENITGVQSITSTTSKPMSIDQSTDVRMVEVKDIEINTSISMKGNKELLEATSSLTLVDDALTQNVFDIDIDTNTSTSHNSFTATKPKSPVKIIYQIDECGIKTEKNDSDFTSTDEVTTELKEHKRKKRNYSSTKNKNTTPSDLDVTPKPTSKVQKMSNSPKNIIKTILDLHRASPEKNKFTSNKIESMRDEEMPSPDKANNKSPRRSKDKTGTTITVQRLITEYHIETSMDQRTLNKQIVEALTDQPGKAKAVNLDEASTLEPVCSFTSSKNVKEQDDNSTTTSSRPVSVCSDKSDNCVNWQTDLANEVGSKNSMSECESSVNVVAKIDMLPFMGSHECEWEWSCGDTWSFRLLHARLRLVVRLAHRHDNAARTCVRADTPVIAVNVEIAQHDKKNPVASICVRFAAETMRYLCAAGCARAGAVPALVRRCAGVARLAARWGRAMHHARAHLAYTLTDDGHLALKVANIPLRSVWEVTMQLELVAEEGAVPQPRAGQVRVSRVVAPREVSAAALHALLAAVPADWGHAPATIWRVFKYLKNKTHDDDLLAA